MRSYQEAIYFHEHFADLYSRRREMFTMMNTGTYSNMDILREVTFHQLCCVKSTRKVSRELKYFINDALEELSTDGFFDLEDSQCLEMMSSKCMGTFKSMYQLVYGRKFNAIDQGNDKRKQGKNGKSACKQIAAGVSFD